MNEKIKINLKKFLNLIKFLISQIRPEIKSKTIFDIYNEEEKINCYNHFKKYFKSALFLESKGTRQYAIKNALRNDPNQDYTYLEFGVYKGASVNDLSKYVKKIYAFDSFEGLKEDMLGNTEAIGTFNLNKQIPNLNKNVVPVVGWIQDTLDNFLEKENPKINFVHIDVDLYQPTLDSLEFFYPRLKKGGIIIVDDYGYTQFPGAKKCIDEFLSRNKCDLFYFYAFAAAN